MIFMSLVRRKKNLRVHPLPGSGGGAGWLVTLSDMLLLLLTFFVLLISMSSFDHSMLTDVFGGPRPGSSGVLNRGTTVPIVVPLDESSRTVQERKDLVFYRRLSEPLTRLLDELEQKLGKALLRVDILDESLELEIMSDKLFGTLDDTLKPQGEEVLRQLALFLKAWHGLLEIEVYTDNFPLQTDRFPDNSRLAAWRGERLAAMLEQFGIKRARILLAAYGADRAVAVNDTPNNRQRNRRIVLRLPDWARILNK